MATDQASVDPQNLGATCGVCGLVGHTRRTCQFVPDEYRETGASSSARPTQIQKLRRINTAGESVPGGQKNTQGWEQTQVAKDRV